LRWEFRVYGDPVPQPRGRIRTIFPKFEVCAALWRQSGGSLKTFMGKLRKCCSGQSYTPDDHPVNIWKLLIKNSVRSFRPFPQGQDLIYRIDLTFLFARPQRLIWKTRPMPRLHMGMKKNDNDNLEKAVWDAITNAGFWEDDGLVVENRTRKFYAAAGELPGVIISIETIDDVKPAGRTEKPLFDMGEDQF